MTRWHCGEPTASSASNAARPGCKTIAEAGKYYSTTNQMLGIQLVTWNDYEEGSEIESGIDNCVTVSAIRGRNRGFLEHHRADEYRGPFYGIRFPGWRKSDVAGGCRQRRPVRLIWPVSA